MRRRPFRARYLILFLITLVAFAGTPGSFRGVLVRAASGRTGWMYVHSRNDMLRLVKLSGARTFYADEIPDEQRRRNPAESLQPGAEVRVTASDDGHSRWYAQEIEILALAPTQEAMK